MSYFQKYWNWWVGQMSDALPKLSSVRKRAAIVAFFQDEALQLRLRDEPKTHLGALDGILPEQQSQSLLAKIDLVTGGNRQVVLSIPESAALMSVAELPLAAEAHLAAVAMNELDRWTPWRPDQAVFTARIVERSEMSGKLTIEITAAPRFVFAQADDLLKENGLALIGLLRERAGQSPQFIEIETDMSSPSRKFRRWRVGLVATAAALLLLVAAGFGWKLAAVYRLEGRVAQLMGEVEEVQKLAGEMKALSHRALYADQAKRERPSAVVVLNTLSQILPDDCWLEAMTMDGDKITIQGHAADALALLPLLTSSGIFQDVKFDSEVVRDPVAGIDNFNLSATALPYAAQ